MERATLEWYELLARSLLWVAGIVLFLAVIGAIVIGSTSTSVPLLEDIQSQSRGAAAIGMLGGGLTAAGLLAGLGAILRILVVGRLEELGDGPGSARSGPDDRQEQLPLTEEPRQRDRSSREERTERIAPRRRSER